MRSFLLISLLWAHQGLAQTFTAKLSKASVSVGEQFTLTYSVDEKAKTFQGPDLGQFMVYSGPNSSVSYTNINGRATTSRTYSYILAASRAGQFVIGPAVIVVNGKSFESNTVNLKVTQGAPQPNQAQSPAQPANGKQNPDQSLEDQISTNLFLKLFVDKQKAVVGEQIIATYKLYINANIRDHGFNRPVYNGFYAQEIELDPGANVTTEVINGRQFKVATVKKVVLTPQQSGELEIPQLEMPMVVQVSENRPPRNVHEQFWGVPARNVKVEIKSNKQKVVISALPAAGQPKDFNGAVGNFTLKTKIDRTEISVNEAINLTVTIEGKGNLELMKAPEIDFPSDFETYDPKLKESIAVSGNGSSGKKTYEYVLIPRFAGEFELDPITYSFYNPSTKSYSQISSDPIKFNVSKAAGGNEVNQQAYISAKQEEIEVIGKDIRYIKEVNSEFNEGDKPMFGSPIFLAVSALPVAGLGFAILFFGTLKRRQGDQKGERSRRANKQAKLRLKAAQKALNASDQLFYEEIFKALFGYLSDKFGIPVSELNRENIKLQLQTRQTPESLISDLFIALDECEMARFAPGVTRSKDEMLTLSTDIIEKLENES